MLQSKATRVQPELTPRQPADEDELDDYPGLGLWIGGEAIADAWAAKGNEVGGAGRPAKVIRLVLS